MHFLAYEWSRFCFSDLIFLFFCLFFCYYHRSRPCRNEEEDDNSPHRREQQQHLEIKAIVWVSPVAYMCICMVHFMVSVPFLHFKSISHWVTCVTYDLKSALCLLCGRDQFMCGFNSIFPLIRFQSLGQRALLSAWTLVDCHLTPFYLNMGPHLGVTGKDGSCLRLSLPWKSRTEKRKPMFLCRVNMIGV